MTAEKEHAKVEMGEPDGLRQVTGVYGQTNFYTGYLKEWKAGRGKFLELLEQLTGSMEFLQSDIYNEEQELNGLKAALAHEQAQLTDEVTELDEALANSDELKKEKERLEEVIESLKTKIAESKNLLTDLEQVLQQAVLMYKKAKATLVSEHAAGKDGLLSLSQVHISTQID